MKIAFNPSTVAALTSPPNNKDITFDLKGHNIFARGVEFKGTDTNTWRPVVDNLISDSTTNSLSAKQGKVLKALIDGKSNSGHTHDDRYLKLTGGTMNSDALIKFADSGSWGTDKGPQGARGGLCWSGQSDYAKLYAEETAADNLDLVIQFGDDNSNGLSIRNKTNTQTSYISASGVITTGIFRGNLDWSYITNKPSSYTPSAHTHAWNSLTHSSTTANQAILTNGSANDWKLYTLNIAAWDNAASKAHSHSNKAVIDGITSTHVSNWNTAYNFVSTISGSNTDKIINKWDEIVNFLAGIDSNNKLNTLLNSKLSIQQLSTKDIVTTKTNNALFWVDTVGSAGSITTGPFTDHPYALLSITNYNTNAENNKFFYRSRLAFNSVGDIKVASCHHQGEYKQDETWYNVLTSKNSGISGSTIKLNGTSITVYSSGTADGRYVKKSGDTMTGALNFANGTWNKVGDDIYMGDHNIGGQLCLMGITGNTGISFHKQGDASIRKSITFNGSILYMNGNCDYASLANQSNLLAMNTVPNKTTSTSVGSWSPISGRYVFHQRWTDTSTGSDGADFGIYLDGNLTANMVLDGYYNSLSGFRIIGAKGGFLKANGTIDNSTYLTSHQSLSNYYTKSEVDTKLNGKLNYRLFWERTNIDLNSITEAWHTYEVNDGTGTANTPTNAQWHQAVQWGTGDTGYAVQLCTAYTSNYSLYLRHKIAGKWHNWIQLAATTDIPSSLKNPNAIKFKDINGNVVTYDGSAAKDLTAGTYIAKLPYGFASFASGATWGNTTGTSFASWNDSTGGSIDFRRDNPSAGKMSIKVDGRVYVNEGRNPVLSAESNNGFWGMRTPDGGNDWIRTPNNGLIPCASGGAGGGHSSLGTSSWYFSTAYIDKIYGSLKGNADTASSANKLTTARNIALGTDLRGSANFDGSGNITINANINACTVSVGSTDTLPFKRIAHFETGGSWNDNALLLYISEGYINGRNGICRVEFRTDNISSSSTSITASAAVRWLVRNGYGLDALYAGYYVTAGKAYIDIYLKTAGGYRGTVIRVLQDSRGGINSNVQLISARYNNENDHKEAYSSIEAAATALYNRAYTRIVSGSDSGIVNYANSTGSTTKLQTARKLWGQSFDGTKDISGSLSGTGSITPGSAAASDIGSNSLDYRYGYFQWIGAKSGTNLRLAANNSDNQIVLHTNGNVGIGTNSPSYRLQVIGDQYTTGWSRASKGFYCQDMGVHFTHNGSVGEIAMTSNNEFTWGSSSTTLYFNHRPVSRGTTVTNFVWKAGSSTSWAKHSLGALDLHGDVYWTNGDATMKIYGVDTCCGKENVAFQSTFDGKDPLTSDYVTSYRTRSAILLQPRGGNVGINVSHDPSYALTVGGDVYSQGYVRASSGFVKGGSSDSYVLLGGGGHKAESSLNVANADKTRALKYTGTGNSEITAYQTDASYMGRKGWASYIICNHGNGSTYYSQTIAMPFWGPPIYRRLEDGTDRGWKKFYTEEAPPSWDNVTNKPSTFTPASHTHTWTSITDKIVVGNEFNIVNAGFKESIWFNYLPINDRSKTAAIASYIMGNGAKGYASVQASGFIKHGSNSSYVLLGDGGHAAISQLSVKYATSAGSATSATKVIVNQHTSNDINYPLVWSNQSNTSSVTENQLYKSWADLYYNPKNKRLTVGGSFEGPYGRFNNQNGGVIVGDSTNARISAIGNQLIFNTGGALRFGDLDWDYSKWAGLKYNYLTKTIYLGIADGSIFTTYEGAQSEGTLNLRANINYIDLNSGTSIRGLSTNGSPYHSIITLKDTSMSLSTYGDMTMSTGPGTMQLSASNAFRVNANDMRFTCKGGFIECSQTGSNEYTWVFNNNIKTTGQIVREGSSQSWVNGRKGALLRETSVSGYHALWSLKTTNGSWDFGEYNAGSDWNNIPVLTYITDTNFNSGNNTHTYQIKFPLASGTVALTSNILNPTDYYWANIKVSASSNTQTKPSVNTIYANNWFRSQGATGWYNESYGGGLHMTDTTWIRTFGNKSFYCNKQIYSSDSIRMGDIYLEHTNEINSASGLHLNYQNSGNVTLCKGGGAVIIGHTPDNIGNNKLYVNGPTTLNSVATFNGLVTNNRGILPASYDVNKNNTACYVWGDAMSTGVTAITDALDPKYVSVHHSQNNGSSWSDMGMANQNKFSLYANNGSKESIYLGANNTTGGISQVQKNQLMVTFEIPDNLYSQICWASIDINNGVQTVCTVEIIAKDGTIKNTFTKNLYGWNNLNYINFWGNNSAVVSIGQDSARFVRFKFKHDAGNTYVRNTLIHKIRIFSYTKHSLDVGDFRSIMANTGHLYKYDGNLNVTFPNAINCNSLNVGKFIINGSDINNTSPTGISFKQNGTTIMSYFSEAVNINKKLNAYDAAFAGRVSLFSIHPLGAESSTDTRSVLIGDIANYKFAFKRGTDGQLLFMKWGASISITSVGCTIFGKDKLHTPTTISGDGKSRIFIYQERTMAWYEFYCA